MNAQKDKAIRELDTNIYKIIDSYKQLLKKSQINTEGSVSVNDTLQMEAAASIIVS